MITSKCIRAFFNFALALFCAVQAIPAEGAATKQYVIIKDAQAIAIAANAVVAMGGIQSLLSYQDSQSSGTVTVYPFSGPVSYPITLKTKTTQETRMEVQLATGTNVRILNTGQAALIRPDGTVKQLLLNNTIAERVDDIPLLSILPEYQNANIQVTYQGTAQVNGSMADVIAVSLVPTTDPSQALIYVAMTQVSIYVDQATSMVEKVEYNTYAENNPSISHLMDVYFSSYQSINGISVPFHVTTYCDSALDSDLLLTSVAFNVGLPDSEFILPQ